MEKLWDLANVGLQSLSLCEARATPTDSHHEPGEQESQITYHRGQIKDIGQSDTGDTQENV